MIDFVGLISANWNATTEVKSAFLVDFCAQYGYQEQIVDLDTGNLVDNPVTRVEFANQIIFN